MKRSYVLLVAMLAMVLSAGIAHAQECDDCDWLDIALNHTYDWEGIDDVLPDFIEGEVTIVGTVEVGGSVLVSAPCASFHDMAQLVNFDCTPTEEPWRTWDFDTCQDIEFPGDLLNPGGETTLTEDHFGLWAFWANGENYLFVLCPESEPPPPEISARITGPHNADPGDSVVLTVVTEGFDEGTETYLWNDASTAATLDLGVVGAGATGVYTCEVGGEVDGEPLEDPIEASFTLWVGVATPLAGGLGLGLLAGACALAGAVSIRRKK